MKKLKQFENQYTANTYGEFLNPLDEIDWFFYEHILCGYVAPYYDNGKVGQAGEATDKKDGVYYHETVMTVGDKYYYLGVLPAFQQPE